jgi:hypothetical protein
MHLRWLFDAFAVVEKWTAPFGRGIDGGMIYDGSKEKRMTWLKENRLMGSSI